MAHRNSFSIKEAIKFGWHTTLKNFWLLFGILIITNVISYIPQIVNRQDQNTPHPASFAYFVVTIFAGIIKLGLSYGMIKIILDLVDHKKVKFTELFSYFQIKRLWPFFLGSLLYGLLILGGFILLIIPGIYFAVKYCFVPYLIIDKDTGIKEAFSNSAKLTEGVKWKLLWFGILKVLICIAGLLVFIIGLFIAAPLVYIADVFIYRKLYAQIKA